MSETDALTPSAELHPALLQAAITLGLAVLCGVLHARYRKPAFLWWAVAWSLYLLRLGAIITFLRTEGRFWLYGHQVATGWTGLALLWSALVFSRGVRLKPAYLTAILFPPAWSYFAIYRFQDFHSAAWPAVAFLSGATLWTAVVFLRFRQQTGSRAALLLGAAFLLWGLHHLDYPLLRARGTWNPWGYYLDLGFELTVGAGILLLVLEDVERGLRALAALSGELQGGRPGGDIVGALLHRALALPGVRGSAMYDHAARRFVRGVGACADWEGVQPGPAIEPAIRRAVEEGRPVSAADRLAAGPGAVRFAFAAVLPVERERVVSQAMVIVGDARDPFTALDEAFLRALGQQVGAALQHAELTRNLARRTAELERLSARMVQQHEAERRRLSLELHDETAQVMSAIKLQLGILREEVPPDQAARLDRVLGLVDDGMQSIRSVTEALRPSLLDDLGLLPALRALVTDFGDRTGLAAALTVPDRLPDLADEAELAIFRAVQEGLANVARHAEAQSVAVGVAVVNGLVRVEITDDGRGLRETGEGVEERMGLTGMRERITALGGTVRLENRREGGTRLAVELPLERPA
ncbi:MAG TPA: GAF domain-containing sensor histidine kinase [Gemmatimonadales bacterium]|nr:GAF domain-containing sensor histidine kinase [Gemmatimonadales bacterium]